MAREFAKQFYRSKEWENVRDGILMRDKYMCVKCGAPAEEVHHKTHLSPENINDPNITLNPDNLASLCKSCHFKEHYKDKAEGHRKNKLEVPERMKHYEFDENGYFIMSQAHVERQQ